MTSSEEIQKSRRVSIIQIETSCSATNCILGVFDEWNLKGTGPLATNGIDAGVKIRPTAQELEDFERWPTPHFKDGWKSYFKEKPDKPVMHYSVIAGWFGDHMLMYANTYSLVTKILGFN